MQRKGWLPAPSVLLLTLACACVACRAGDSGRIAQLERENAALEKRVEALELWLSMRTHDAPSVSADALYQQNKVDARVIDVNRVKRMSLVVLDKGSRDGVELGYVFDVFAGATYKGQVRITDVREGRCNGIILCEPRPIERGDCATTQL